jgi:histone acetyltransferase
MEHKLETNQYPNMDVFVDDAQLVFDNCRIYNPDGSIYARNAGKMEKFLKEQLGLYCVKKEEC